MESLFPKKPNLLIHIFIQRRFDFENISTNIGIRFHL